MKKLFTFLTMLVLGIGSMWAEDYSQGFYTISPGAGVYWGFYSASNANSKYGGTSSSDNVNIPLFTFEKAGQDDVYYWYDCNNKKYIYADGNGYLQVADSKEENNNNYKWFIKDNGDGTLTITDMTNYNDGNLTKGLVQLTSTGGWWASKCTLSSNTGRNTWKFNLVLKKNTPYYIALGRGGDRFLTYSNNKMTQAVASSKDATHIWYFTSDESAGAVNIYAYTNTTAMGYDASETEGADKISTTKSVKQIFPVKAPNSTYPVAFRLRSGNEYISNHGGTTNTNMGIWNGLNDPGTYMQVTDADVTNVNIYTNPYNFTYTGGAGTSESRVSINHNGGSATLTGADKTYYLTGSNSATQTTINFDGTTVNYNNELGIGTATYNINNTQITTPKFVTSQGGGGRPAVVNLTGNSVITVTGSSNVDTNQSSIMIGHWNGSSNLTLSGTAQINAAEAQLLVGKTGNTQTITLNENSNITAKGIKVASNASGTNTLNLNGGSLNLGDVGITSYSSSRSIAVNVNENTTITATASTLPLSQPITIASGKTLTIDGGESNATVTLNSLTNNGTVNFNNVTVTLNRSERDLSGYSFTNCTATLQFVETGDEYKNGGFTITNIPSGVTVKVKKYDGTDYETVTPEAGTATISHEVGVSGLAAWLDYTFNESTKSTNIHSPADQVITNAGNAGSGNNLTIDTDYNTGNSYNDDGTLKVMSTPWRNITWPTNYTVAVAGNVPDVENGCLVAFGSTTAGSSNYLAIVRGANQNEIKLVKGHGMNSAFEVISTMTAANATALSHLVVFTKNGNTFTVYLDGIQKTQVTYSDALGGGFQIGSIHGGVTGTGVGRVNDMAADIKEKIFAKAVRVYDYVISDDQMSQLTEEFPYTSFGGKYTRTITEDSNLSATGAWLNANTQGNVDIPVNAVVDEVIYYPDVEITTDAASTLTVNADMDTENIKFDGAGKLTIASDGTHHINISGSVTANGPVSVKYGEIDLTAVPVSIGESGSVEFDFSASDFSGVTTSTYYLIIGNTSDYGNKVTGVYPSDIYHTFTITYNSTTNSYYLTVGPSVAFFQQRAINLVKPYYDGRYVGTGLGKYTISLGETSYAEMADFGTAVMSWQTLEDCVDPTIAINQPTSAFYRIKSGDKYLQDARKSDSATQRTLTDAAGANSAETIFYLDNNKFIGYKTGYGFGFSVCQTQDTEQLNTQLFTESAEMGKYTIQSQQGTCTSADNNVGYWGVEGSDLSREADAASGACWKLEPATSVPVTLKKSALGYATFCCPVPVKIPSGVEAFVSKIEGNTIKLFRIENFKDAEENVVIPANTAVMLHNKNFNSQDETFSFEIAEYSGEGITDNGFDGTIAAESMVAGNTYYSLRTWKVNDVPTKVGFATKTSGSLAGFKAWICEEGQSARNFTIVFDSDSDPTGIVEALGLEDANVEIYDLNGRKLSSYKRGINIVNGKKVMVK